jgi:hypothetical protein
MPGDSAFGSVGMRAGLPGWSAFVLQGKNCGFIADGGMMRIVLNIVASLMVVAGAIWFLQGINVLPGSFMTGQTRWAVYGGIAFAAGIALLLLSNRPRKAR